jgi:ribosomal protein S18 acetylase RimI-like enzyme
MASPPIGSDALTPSEATQYWVRAIDPDNDLDAAAAARLHAKLFRDIGPIAKLGEHLLARYCYSYLIRTGLMKAVLFEVSGEPVGLAAYTGDSVELHRAALRRHLPFVARETLRALVAQPSLLFRLPAAATLIWERRREKLPTATGNFAEVISFGILPRYRSHKFVRLTGLHIPDLLLDYVLDDLRSQNFPQVRGVVLVSNRPAVRFFSRRASRVDPFTPAVRPSIQVWLDLTLDSAHRPR